MAKIVYYIDLFITFIKIYFKRCMSYKTDFILGVIPLIFTQLIGILFIKLIYLRIPAINGWQYEEVLLVYSFYTLISALESTFFYSLTQLKTFIFQGTLDTILIRPINSIFYIIIQEFNYYSIGQAFLGIFLLVYSIQKLSIQMTFGKIIMIIYFILLGTIILASLTLISVTFFLFTEGTFSPLNAIIALQQFIKYPLSIFNKYIQSLLTLVFPLAFVSFFPAKILIGGNISSLNICIIELIVTFMIFALGNILFNYGLKKYKGTGN